MIDKQQIEEAAEILANKIIKDFNENFEDNTPYYTKLDVFYHIKESFIKGAELALSQPKDVEEIRKEFEELWNKEVGVYLPSEFIWNFFTPYLQPQQSDAVELIKDVYEQLQNEHLSEFMEPLMERLEQFKETRK